MHNRIQMDRSMERFDSALENKTVAANVGKTSSSYKKSKKFWKNYVKEQNDKRS